MRKIIRLVLCFAILVVMASCMKSPNGNPINSEPGNKPLETVVPQDFDWKTTQDITLNGNINDQYAGRYLYRVDVFVENPVTNPKALLLKGVSTKSSFTLSLTVPKGVKTLYVRQTDPRSRKIVQSAEIVGNQATFSFANEEGQSGMSAKGAVVNYAKAPTDVKIPSTPNNAIKIESGNVTLTKNNDYVIPRGTVYVGTLTFPGEGNASLFVEGEWNIGQNITLQTSTNIIVQSSGVVKSDKDLWIEMIGNASLQVASGAKFEAADMDIKLKDTPGSIVNAGNITVENIAYSPLGTLINIGTLKITEKLSSHSGITISNSGSILAEEFDFVGGKIDNYSMMEIGNFTINSNNAIFNNYATLIVTEEGEFQNMTFNNYCYVKFEDETKLNLKGTTINTKDNTVFSCYDVECSDGTTSIDIGKEAMFEVRNKIVIGANQNKIKGFGKNTSLMRLKNVELKGWESVFYNKVQIECLTHTQNASQWDRLYVLDKSASMVSWGESTVVIPENECSGIGNNPGGGSGGEGDQDGDVVYDQSYTYVMEDNWPHFGDYDMNDMVLELTSFKESIKNKTLTFNFRLLNVGATKVLGAGVQLDGITLSQIDRATSSLGGSIEGNQKYVVIPFFTDAHALLGVTSGRPSVSPSPKEITLEVAFKNADEVKNFKISSLNLYITTSDKANANRRKEIHLSGYLPTDIADMGFFGQGEDNSRVRYYTSKDNFVWGILIPSKFAYPKEGTNIAQAYPDFINWLSSGGSQNQDWYEKGESKYTNN